mgnify:FL=1
MISDSGKWPPPRCETGWSRTVLRLRNVVVDPSNAALYHHGRHVPEGALYRNGSIYRGNAAQAPSAVNRTQGRHLWGGPLFSHFGHFLTESLSRLWAVRDSGVQSIVFSPKDPGRKRQDRLPDHQDLLLKCLHIDLPVRIVHEPEEFEDLLIAGPGFGLGPMAAGTPEFREFLRAIAVPSDMTGRKRLYLSRSALPEKAGSILAERHLEQLLERQGFKIYHPQQHSITEQFATFRAARQIIGPDGSAFHLAGFVTDPGQSFTIIKRRSAPDHANIVDQLVAMGAKVQVVDAIRANWIRPGKRKADDRSWAELDFADLFARLSALGLLSAPVDASDLELPPIAQEVERIGHANKGQMTRLATG